MEQTANPYGAPKAAVEETIVETRPVRLFSVSGRIGRARYIAYGVALWFAGMVVIGLLSAILIPIAGEAGTIVALIGWAALLALGFMLTIQRCHDFNANGWLSLLLLLPLVNFVFWFIPGTRGPNRYGPATPPNTTGVIVGAAVAPLGLVLFVGIIAAITFPAYGDYTHRAKISEVILSASEWRTAVTEHYLETQKLPAGVAELRKENVPATPASRYGTVTLGADGVLTLTMSSQLGSLADKTILMRPRPAGNALEWDCTGGTLAPKYRPSACRPK